MEFTIKQEAKGYVELLKSKFYSFAIPVKDVEKFKTRLEQIRKENPKAKHIVYAYRIGVNSKSTDDKEPKGTAGRPLLELLMKKNLNNTALIVVRYFGGIKLGAGPLMRVYKNTGAYSIKNINQ